MGPLRAAVHRRGIASGATPPARALDEPADENGRFSFSPPVREQKTEATMPVSAVAAALFVPRSRAKASLRRAMMDPPCVSVVAGSAWALHAAAARHRLGELLGRGRAPTCWSRRARG
jgi:hypothetical protein